MSVPIFTSPGRSGFGPQLSLSYDSAAGNGPFGLGWSLSLPSITRKTDRGIPLYRDYEPFDVFILAGAEDLVPFLVRGSDGKWAPESILRTANGSQYRVDRYRPRIESAFSLIERWTAVATQLAHWRVVSRDNITTVFGDDDSCRISDPDDARRIFSWLISRSYDDKGNVIVYTHIPEDYAGISVTAPHERNRPHATPGTQCYLASVNYGNTDPYLPDFTSASVTPLPPNWLFEVDFDYGGPDPQSSSPLDSLTWTPRPDPFSSYRAGFEVRTHRLCRRVLMFHDFGAPQLVRSTDFGYVLGGDDPDPLATPFSFLQSVRQTGYNTDANQPGGYRAASTPPVEFTYTHAQIDDQVRELDTAALENLPIGVSGPGYQWVDLDGEGLSGVLTEQGGHWYYKRNRGNGEFDPIARVAEKPSFAELGSGRQQLMDLGGDGALDIVDFSGAVAGVQERTDDESWHPFTPFASLPRIDWTDANLRFIDLTGDGRADALRTEHDQFTWYESLGEEGFTAARYASQPRDEERGPRIVFADGTQTIFIADMSGDGLQDIVRICKGEVCYWPNLGYGRFGAKITMDNAPWFDHAESFDPRRIRLADVDGSGVTDIVYLSATGARLYINRSGNALSDGRDLPFPLSAENLHTVQVADLFGNGTACLVWSSAGPADARDQVRYLDLMGGTKPNLLTGVKNNFGGETQIEYAPSTRFYIEDARAGNPWITKLPFPVHCVATVSVTDRWRQCTYSTRYSYHHGYFDGVEREFRGFARVEQIDVERFGRFAAANVDSPYVTQDQTLFQPPVKTISWFHTGAPDDLRGGSEALWDEFFNGIGEKPLSPPRLPGDLSPDEWREAFRACKGLALRQEIYELDVDALEPTDGSLPREIPVRLFSVTARGHQMRLLQHRDREQHAAFLPLEAETLTYNYELDLGGSNAPQPDPRITQTLNLTFDAYGQSQQSVAIGYARVRPFTDSDAALQSLVRSIQSTTHVAYTETRFTGDAIDPATDVYPRQYHRVGVPCDIQTFELTGFVPSSGVYFDAADFLGYDISDRYVPSGTLTPVARKEYHEQAQSVATRRVVAHSRTLFFRDDPRDTARYLQAPYPLGTIGPLGLVYEQYKLALTETSLTRVFTASQLAQQTMNGGTVHAELRDPTRCGYVDGTLFYGSGTTTAVLATATDEYWMRSGVAGFASNAPQHFFLPERYTDAFGNPTTLTFDAFDLLLESSTDAKSNSTSVTDFDYRVLAPRAIEDINANFTEAYFDLLGRVIAIASRGDGTNGDNLDSYTEALANPSRTDRDAVFVADPPETAVRTMLDDASSRFLYHFGETVDAAGNITWESRPAGSCTIVREEHTAAVSQRQLDDPKAKTALQISFECSDGSGAVLLERSQAEPATTGGARRWIVSGKTVLNNKGKPVKQYEPYFSASAVCRGEGALQEEVGVTPLLYYDAPGRLVRTELPDGTITRVEFSPWHVTTYDANDAVLESSWYTDRSPLPPDQPLPRNALNGAPLSTADQRAAWLAARHAGTPTVALLDSLGRSVVTIVHNRVVDAGGPLLFGGVRYLDEQYRTFTKLDAEGKALWIRDARGNLVVQYVRPAKPNDDPSDAMDPAAVPCYDIAGNLLYQHSMDAGDRWMLNDAAGKPVFAWDERGNFISTRYDELHRPTTVELTNPDNPNGIIVALTQYAGRTTDDVRYNRCGQPWRTFDQSGVVTNNEFDFKGNALVITRRLADAYDVDVDWSSVEGIALTDEPDPLLMAEAFTQITEYDALSRPTLQYQWHVAGGEVAVVLPKYNERSLPLSTTLWVGATKTASSFTGGTSTVVVSSVTYDAKGQRLRTALGNGVVTTFAYDPKTFRLATVTSTRAPNETLQALSYVYDPTGNVMEIGDDAVPAEFFDNVRVDPTKRYEYDALYRLNRAEGREHAGQTSTQPNGDWNDCPFRVPYAATDAKAWRTYVRTYEYDAVGNILEMRHLASGSSAQSWTRQYEYAVDSNRLLATGIGVPPLATHYPSGGPTLASVYQYNAHGSITTMPHLPQMDWDFTEHLGHISRSAASAGTGPDGCPDSSLEAWYRYDTSKQRTRKRVVKQGGIIEERFYFGQVEWYRRWRNDIVEEEIATLHLLDEQQRLLMVDQVRTGAAGASTLYRYTLSDHLGSSTVELDENSRIISFEEYHPYGTTAYQSGSNASEVRRKRYRYTGMERDEESGFSYHAARYAIVNLARWLSCDPSGVTNGINRYELLAGNPVRHVDRTGLAPGDSGEETRVVRPFLESFARSNRLRFITEVPLSIEVPGVGSIGGRPDYLFLIPRAKSWIPPFLWIETKGWNLQDFTEHQELYVPAINTLRGVRAGLTSNRARTFGLGEGANTNVNYENYLILGRPNMMDLASAYAQYTSGKTYPYSFMSKTGQMQFAETQEEFYAMLQKEGLNPLEMTPPGVGKSSWSSNWQGRVGGAAAAGIFLFAMFAPKIAAAGVANKLERQLKEMEPEMAAARADNPDSWSVLRIQYAVDAPPEGITQLTDVNVQFRMIPKDIPPATYVEAMEAEPQLTQNLLYTSYQRPQFLVIPPANQIQVPVMPAR